MRFNVNGLNTSVAEPHENDAAQALGKNFDAATYQASFLKTNKS
jgi:hypothetical protein